MPIIPKTFGFATSRRMDRRLNKKIEEVRGEVEPKDKTKGDERR